MKKQMIYSSCIYDYDESTIEDYRVMLADGRECDVSEISDDDIAEINADDWDYIEEDLMNVSGTFVAFGSFGTWRGPQSIGYIGDDLLKAVRCPIPNEMCNIRLERTDRGLVSSASYHDGSASVEIRMLTDKGEAWYRNHKDDYDKSVADIIKHVLSVKCYTKRVIY